MEKNNEYENLILPKLESNTAKYKTIEIQALYDRSKSVDPHKKMK